MQTHKGSCHCGDVKFSFKQEEITAGLRCNCSLCKRKGALMTNFVIPPDELTIELKNEDSLGLYEFDDKTAHHYFCKRCGIYPFHQTSRMPEHYRVNLGCIDDIETEGMEEAMFDGKNLL